MDNMIANCHKCKYEITAECVPRSQKMSYPKCFVSIITNYDRLISKTPEELAKWLDDNDSNFPISDGGERWLSWLKSPVEEVDNA